MNRFPDTRIKLPINYVWNRRKTIELGKGVILDGVRMRSDTKIGDYTSINSGCEIQGYEGAPLKIGKYCGIACNCIVITFNHPMTFPSTFEYNLFPTVEYEKIIRKYSSAPVTIGNNVWMGFGSAVMPGVNVGDGAIIGAGAVVTKDVEPFTVGGGCLQN